MGYEIIKKSSRKKPNMVNYEEMRKSFKWEDIYNDLDGLGEGRINIAYEAISRHTKGKNRDKIAMYWHGKNGEEEVYTFLDLENLTNKFANVLKNLGVIKGDRVFTYLERIPENYISLIAALKCGAVMAPLFSAFGSEAVFDRLEDSQAKILITSSKLIHVINKIRKDLPKLEKIIVVTKRDKEEYIPKDGEVCFEEAMEKASSEFDIALTSKDDYAIMHYTSGTTGKPKGVVHVHEAILGHYATAKYILDLQEDDIYWCTADPGWVTGTSYGMFGPWSNGVTLVVDEGGFSASRWYSIIEKYKVSVWYTAPTAIRMLMKAGEKIVEKYDLSSLRIIHSVGEPLNPEAVVWSNKVFGLPFHDNWWQTETGCIQIANYQIQDIRPGSMGRPFLGVTAAILDDEWKELPPGEEGHLALKPPWPSMFRTYWNKEDLYNSRFKNGWYITGDRARMDEDGYFWFVGRADDVINTSGHLVGPFEIESALIEHPKVAEAGVIGIPDKLRMEVPKAFVALKDGYEPSAKLKNELKHFVRERLASYACPQEIDFVKSLPKTRSGKIMRRLLKARELGLPEGDISTLEE
jgi:acetyl-CoA synthetase